MFTINGKRLHWASSRVFRVHTKGNRNFLPLEEVRHQGRTQPVEGLALGVSGAREACAALVCAAEACFARRRGRGREVEAVCALWGYRA